MGATTKRLLHNLQISKLNKYNLLKRIQNVAGEIKCGRGLFVWHDRSPGHARRKTLSEEDHFVGGGLPGGFQAININAAGDGTAGIIPAVPLDRMQPGRFPALMQRPHNLALDIINHQFYLTDN